MAKHGQETMFPSLPRALVAYAKVTRNFLKHFSFISNHRRDHRERKHLQKVHASFLSVMIKQKTSPTNCYEWALCLSLDARA